MTKPTKEEADALRAFIPLLAPLHSPRERATMAMQMEGRIAGRETSLMALSHRQIGALFYPGDAARAADLEQQIAKARASGELATRIPDGKGLLIADLAGWLGCPPISPRSPLRYWLNHLEVLDDDYAQVPAEEPTDIDYSLLATREQLVKAFGSFTGLDMSWFKRLNDMPALLAARKVKGRSGKNPIEPFFCPYAVMQWLTDHKRKKGGTISETTAWRMLKAHFPKVHAQHEAGDPNAH